jgi:hypothetical protein
MEERFPNLIEKGSHPFERFFILVSKCSSASQNKKSIIQRFWDLCGEFESMMAESRSNLLEADSLKRRIAIFTALATMCVENRVHFIDA